MQESPQWDQWIQQAFDAFDIDGSGLLSYNELNQMLCGEVCPVRLCRLAKPTGQCMSGTAPGSLPCQGRGHAQLLAFCVAGIRYSGGSHPGGRPRPGRQH